MVNFYQENILDHYHHPRNFGTLDKPDFSAEEYNSLCGDRIEIFLKVKPQLEIKFQGEGCAISQAAASLLTEHLKKLKTLDQIKNINEDTVLKLLGVDLTPARRKCALIAYQALRKALTSL